MKGKPMKKGNSDPIPADLLAELKALESLPDSDIDLSDSPEVTLWSEAARGKYYRPVKQLLSVRLDADLIDWFKASGSGYQTRINAALREFVLRHQTRL